jgi:hypothetical protein
MTDLFDSPDHLAQKERMKRLIVGLAKKTKDPMLDRVIKACKKSK